MPSTRLLLAFMKVGLSQTSGRKVPEVPPLITLVTVLLFITRTEGEPADTRGWIAVPFRVKLLTTLLFMVSVEGVAELMMALKIPDVEVV